jgi:hypothetical protein
MNSLAKPVAWRLLRAQPPTGPARLVANEPYVLVSENGIG